MKKLFLTSSFADVATLLPDFFTESLNGKSITFIPTAALHEEVDFYVAAGKKALEKLGFVVDVLDISSTNRETITRILQKNAAIYVSGGNTFFLLQELKKKAADKAIINEISAGKLYIGESAGSMILAPDISYAQEMDDRNLATALHDDGALNVVSFYPVPHQGDFPFKKVVEKIIAQYGEALKLYPISNAQVITVAGDDVTVL